jgi:hypothetical protein
MQTPKIKTTFPFKISVCSLVPLLSAFIVSIASSQTQLPRDVKFSSDTRSFLSVMSAMLDRNTLAPRTLSVAECSVAVLNRLGEAPVYPGSVRIS